jgi:hypothetical protein
MIASIGSMTSNRTFMFIVAFMHLSLGTSTVIVKVTPEERVSTIKFGLIEIRGLRSLPPANSFEKTPA